MAEKTPRESALWIESNESRKGYSTWNESEPISDRPHVPACTLEKLKCISHHGSWISWLTTKGRKRRAKEVEEAQWVYIPFKYTRQALHIIFKSHFFLILELIDCENNRDKYKVDINFVWSALFYYILNLIWYKKKWRLFNLFSIIRL